MRISDWSSDVCSSDLQAATWLSWLRNASQSPAARNILRLIERLAYVRALGLDRGRADMIPASTFDRLADEGSRITPQHLGELNALRRHATLAATGIRLEEDLTDATLTMFDKLLGSMVRRAENRTRDKALKIGRASCRERVCQDVKITVGAVQ